ncbi:MAG: hypothetical protein L0312_25785 [Acidobacteria bacterium]|nr:hypothetical protein [Acidobacteriota bacterium]
MNRGISRRQFIQSTLAFLGTVAAARLMQAPAYAADPIAAGAIRWDAWYSRTDNSVHAQNALSSAKYLRRAPSHCDITPNVQVLCEGSQAVLDAEIRAAVRGGLDYWAFCWYAEGSSFRRAWNLYQASGHRDLIKWCGIVSLPLLGSLPFKSGKWKARIQEWVGYMRQPHYQKVTAGAAARPLLYVLWYPNHLRWYFDNSLTHVREAFDHLRDLAVKHGLDAPYIVILRGPEGADIARATGADAISSYISGFQAKDMGTYADLAGQTQRYWEKLRQSGESVVPIAMVGWDTRARQERPVPWHYGRKANPNPTRYFALATPEELATHLWTAVNYIDGNPKTCPARTLLIYSWNECDEGGGLIPTKGDPEGAYLSAIRDVLS